MIRSIGKFAAFLLITGSCVLILKMSSKTNSDNGQMNPLVEQLSRPADTSFYFIGSSRVQKSIDPEIIKSHYDNFRVMNLGIQGGNFLSNCVMADFIIQQPGHKVVFIELSLRLDELPDGIFNFSSQTGMSSSRSVLALSRSQSLSERSILLSNVLNHQLFKSIAVGEEARQIIGYKTNHDNDQWIGFHPYDDNYVRDSNSFLTWRDINTTGSNSIDLTTYEDMIRYLKNLAKRNDAQIVFFLPVTCRTQVEKDVVTQLYQAISDSVKLEVSADFLEQMIKGEYLRDENHLNIKGAKAYSRLLIPLLERYSVKSTSQDNY